MRKAATSLTMTLAIALIAAADAKAEIAWQTNLRAAHAQAQSEGKLLLLHFYSDNCTWCEKLEQGAFQEPQVAEAISQGFVPVKVHANTSPKLAEMFKVKNFPRDVIVTTDGKTLSHAVSPQSADRYVSMLTSSSPVLADDAPNEPETSIASTIEAPQSRLAKSSVAAPSGVAPQIKADDSVPGYAAAPKPEAAAPKPEAAAPSTTVSEPIASAAPVYAEAEPAMTLPNGGLSGGATSQLTGSKGMSLQMPGVESAPQEAASAADQVAKQYAAPAQSSPSVESAPALPDSITASVSDVAAAKATQTAPSAQQPELAMQGFCPVTVIAEDKWIEGNPEYGVIHLGKLYLFTNQEKMETFLSDPVPYTPVLNEIDAVVFFEERRVVPGKREWGLKDPIYNRMFFFADEASMNHFYNQYELYTKAAIEVMDKAVKDANPGT